MEHSEHHLEDYLESSVQHQWMDIAIINLSELAADWAFAFTYGMYLIIKHLGRAWICGDGRLNVPGIRGHPILRIRICNVGIKGVGHVGSEVSEEIVRRFESFYKAFERGS